MKLLSKTLVPLILVIAGIYFLYEAAMVEDPILEGILYIKAVVTFLLANDCGE